MVNTLTAVITEPVFIAASFRELEDATLLLDGHGIAFTTKRTSFIRPLPAGSVCEGVAFYVLARQADYCRQALEDHGLVKGILPAGIEEHPAVRVTTSFPEL